MTLSALGVGLGDIAMIIFDRRRCSLLWLTAIRPYRANNSRSLHVNDTCSKLK